MKEKPEILGALDLSYFNVVQRMYLMGGRGRLVQRSRVLSELLGRTAVVALALSALESCELLNLPGASKTGGNMNAGGTVDTSPSVALDKGSLALTVGGSQQLAATVSPATASDKALTWSSSDPAIVTVSSGGLVTALAKGSATVTVALTNGAKTATVAVEVSAFLEPEIPTDGLVAEWLLGGNAIDTSGNGYTGVNHGAVAAVDRFGVEGKALSFNGTSAYVDCGNKGSFNLTKDFTVAVWVYPTAYGFLDGIISKSQSNGVSGFALRMGYYSPYSTVNFDQKFQTSYLLEKNTWYLIVFTVDQASIGKVYINGILAATETVAIGTGGDPVNIGRDFGSRYFHGSIDDLRIYNRVLGGTEIQALVTEGG